MAQIRAAGWKRKGFVIIALLVAVPSCRLETRQATASATTGVIAGRVTADQGVVRAFRVKAKDTVHLIVYTVYTNKGSYRINNLPPSTYQVQVMEEGFESPAQTVEVKAGETKSVDVALKATPLEPTKAVEFVEYETLYPPGRARDILELHAFGFHGPYFHRMRKRTADRWAFSVDRMFNQPGKWPQPAWEGTMGSSVSGGYNPAGFITDEEKRRVIEYLAANFGPDSPDRDLKKDVLVRDEDALAQAIWIQYEKPPLDESKPNHPKNSGLQLNRGTHDVFPSRDPRRRGTVWLAESGSNSILAIDTRNLDPKTRTKEWVIDETRAKMNVAPNTIVEHNGQVYWTELKGDHIGHLNLATGEVRRHLAPKPAQAMHGIGVDSRGDVWYVGLTGTVGRFRVKEQTFDEWEPTIGTFYQMRIDQKDRVWVASVTRRMIGMFDPKTEKWTTYKTPDNVRRIDVDSRGKVWANEYFANAVVMLDPDTGKLTEYKLPLKYGNPYETCVDEDDNVWLENQEYQSYVRFDPRTKSFTYFPYPDMGAHTPDMESDAEGTLWSGLNARGGQRGQPYLTSFTPRGNVPSTETVTRR